MFEDEKLLKELITLRQEHQDLDEILTNAANNSDQLTLQRIKKRKLWLKDKIAQLEATIYPDIIA